MRVYNVRFVAEHGNPSYHPGCAASVFCGTDKLGTLGQVHPSIAENYGLHDVFTAELDFTSLLEHRADERVYVPLPRYPSIMRDIAVVCDISVSASELSDCILRSGGALLRHAKPFDVYTGSQVPDGKKSIAFSLTLRSEDQTLTDEHADNVIKNILSALFSELNAIIR